MGAVRPHRHSSSRTTDDLEVPEQDLTEISHTYSYLLEHGLKPDGTIDAEAAENAGDAGSYDTFFTETSGGKYVPRSIFVDLDPSVRISIILPRSATWI